MSGDERSERHPDQLTGGFIVHSGSGIKAGVKPTDMSHPDPLPRGVGAGKGRKTKLSCLGIDSSILREGDPRYRAALYQANKYRKTRMKELADLHGHVSAGAGAMLASASLALAASRFLYERYAESMEGGGGDTETLKVASGLADKARAAELAAWEMSAREGVLKRRTEASAAGAPWLLTAGGKEKAKPGRKTNVQRVELEADGTIEVTNE